MNMFLSIQEERSLNEKQIKRETEQRERRHYKPKYVCGNGHRLFFVYWRDHTLAKVFRIKNDMYCPECNKFYKEKDLK